MTGNLIPVVMKSIFLSLFLLGSSSAIAHGTPSEHAREVLTQATEQGGPEAGIAALKKLMADPKSGIETNGHDLAHVVGRVTAKTFGYGGDVFLRCPNDFFYGCQHGFFEEVLTHQTSGAAAAQKICNTLKNAHDRFFCYHGAGHGIVMAKAYRLESSLKECASLGEEYATQGCLQGVFMEHVNAELRGEGPKDLFSKQDPLAPCNHVKEEDQWACFVNMAPYLLRLADGDWNMAIQWCERAPSTWIGTCIFDFGQIASDPDWQKETTLAGVSTTDPVKRALALCDAVPEAYRTHCTEGAVEHFVNYGKTKEATLYCDALSESSKEHCSQHLDHQETTPPWRLESPGKNFIQRLIDHLFALIHRFKSRS